MGKRTRLFVGAAAAALMLTAMPVPGAVAAPTVSYEEAVPGLAPSGVTSGVYTDGTWRRKACGENGNLKPGGGSARRVPARRDCDTADMTSWRNHVDVDVNWEVDSGEVRNRQADVACRVTGPDQ